MLSIRSAFPALPLVAGLSANHLGALQLPPRLRRLYISRDRDRDGTEAARRLRDRATPHGIEVIDLVPQGGDFNVDLQRIGVAALRMRIMRLLVRENAERYGVGQPACIG